MKYLITIAMILLGTQSFANNVIQVQHELRPDQVEWLNEHRADENVGQHQNFVYYRDDKGNVWSASLNEYKKTRYASRRELVKYFEEVIAERVAAEQKAMAQDLTKAFKLFEALINTMDFDAAYILTQSIFEGFYLDEETGAPSYQSSKYDVSISIN